MKKKEIGQYGEDLAARFLIGKGFVIVERNFRTRWGEIDLIVKKEKILHFVEVKTRTSLQFGAPTEAINYFKQQRLLGAANMFLLARNRKEKDFQFDAVSIVLNIEAKTAKIRLIENILVQ